MDKVCNSKDRVIDPILEAKGQVVMPAKSNSIDQHDYDRYLYKAKHLIENFFAKLKQYRGIATRYDKWLKTSYQRSTLLQQRSGLIENTSNYIEFWFINWGDLILRQHFVSFEFMIFQRWWGVITLYSNALRRKG
nr:transposase [Acinetobacter kyonggiensis]